MPRSPHWLALTSRRPSTPSTTMCLPSVSSHSSVLSALPPADYGLISTAVKSLCVLADTCLLWPSATVAYRRVQCLALLLFTAYVSAVGELIWVVQRVIPSVRRWHADPNQHGQHQCHTGHRQACSLLPQYASGYYYYHYWTKLIRWHNAKTARTPYKTKKTKAKGRAQRKQ